MFKTILVPLTGFDSDAVALDTAYVAGRAFNAHIQCLHVRADPAELTMRASAYDLGTGADGTDFFASLEEESELRSKRAHIAFAEFCKRWSIPLADTPPGPHGVSAAWREIKGNLAETTIALARVHDLVVLARSASNSGFSLADIGTVLIGSGKPLLLTGSNSPESIGATIAVAWKNSPESARALTACMPMLSRARKVPVLTAEEESGKAGTAIESAENVVTQLRWNGVKSEARYVIAAGRSLHDAVLETASALGADLLVMGGYGHSRIRELVFGGFTRQVLLASQLPVLLFH